MTARWPEVCIGEVADQVKRPVRPIAGENYRQIGVRLWGEGAYERDLLDGGSTRYKTLNRAQEGDIIVNKIWARGGSVSVVSPTLDGALCSGEFPLFRPKRDRLEPKWFLWITKARWFWQRCDDQSRGTSGKNRIRPEKFMQISIPLPPLAEQRRIVAKIEHLAAKVEEARRLCGHATAVSEQLLPSYVGRVFSRLELRHRPKTFASFSPHITSGPRNWGKHYEPHGFRFYRAQDVGTDGHVLEGAKVFVAPPPGEQGRSAMLECGDLMLVITGATVGRVCVFREGLEPGLVSQHVAICRLPATQVDPEFALWGLRGPQGRSQLLNQRYGQGKPGLNLSNVHALSLPFPPMAEQRRVAAQLRGFEDYARELTGLRTRASKELDTMMPTILGRAFRGEL